MLKCLNLLKTYLRKKLTLPRTKHSIDSRCCKKFFELLTENGITVNERDGDEYYDKEEKEGEEI